MAVLTHFRHQQLSKMTSFMNAVSDHTIFVMTIITGQGRYVVENYCVISYEICLLP